MAKEVYDIIIVGAGAAGLAAAIYAARYKLKTLVISKEIGGVVVDAHTVENYPGFKKISGLELMDKFYEHAKDFGVEIVQDEIIDIKKNKYFKLKSNKKECNAKTLVLAMGSERRKLNVRGEKKFRKKGVSYCYTCDAPLSKDRTVAVVGGSDAAARAAQLAAEYAKKVYVIYRKDKLRAEPYLVEQLEKNKKIEFIYNTNVIEVKGDTMLSSVILDSKKELKLDILFVEIGQIPNTSLTKKLGVKVDKQGYIIVDAEQKTNVNCVYAAGDITNASNKFRQLTTAISEGSIAAESIYKLIKKRSS